MAESLNTADQRCGADAASPHGACGDGHAAGGPAAPGLAGSGSGGRPPGRGPECPALLRARQLILDQLLGDEIRPLVQARYDTISARTQADATRLAVFNAQNTVATVNAIAEMAVFRAPVEDATLGRLVRDTLVPSVATSQELSATVSTWWTRQAAHLEQRVYDQINVGIVQGETLPQLIRRAAGDPRTGLYGWRDGPEPPGCEPPGADAV